MSSGKDLIRKYYDVGPTCIAASNVYTGGTTGWSSGVADHNSNVNYWLTGLGQGTTDTTRLALSVAVKSLDVRVQVNPDETVAGSCLLRMIIFSDNECQGAPPNLADLLGPVSTTSSTGLAMEWLQPGYFSRFKIIEDKHWAWESSGSANTLILESSRSFWYESHHNMNHRVQWDATDASAIANARKGHIFITFIYQCMTTAAGGVLTNVTTNPPGVQYTTRIRFIDV